MTIRSQKLLLGCVCRPPDDYSFYNKFCYCLKRITKGRKNVVILGDLNSDLLARGYEGRRLSRILGSLDLHNVMKEPARVTKTSTIIDLLITSDTSEITASGVFDRGLSDHCLIYGTLNLNKDKTRTKYVTVKNYRHLNIKNLKYDMECPPWPVIETFDNINDMTWGLGNHL